MLRHTPLLLRRGGWGHVLFFIMMAGIVLTSCSDYAANYHPPRLEAGTFRSRALLSVGRQREFTKFFLEALRQKHKGNPDAAFDLLDRALAINPNASEALYEQAQLLLELSQITDSLLIKRGEEQLLKAHQLEPGNPFFRKTLADRFAATKKYARAARLYEEITAQHAKSEDLALLIRLHELSHNYSAALSTLDRFETIEGRNEGTALQRFTLYRSMGNKSQAFDSMRSFCEENPEDLRLRVVLGDLYLQDDYRGLALAIYDDVNETDPDNPYVPISMLEYHKMLDSTENFHRQLSDVLQHSRISAEQKFKVMQRYTAEALQGRLDKLRLYEHFRELLATPQSNAMLGELAAFFVDAANLPEDSLEMPARAILRDKPEDLQARLIVLRHNLMRGRHEEIIELCREGQRIHPNRLVFGYYEALALLNTDRRKAAIETLAKSATRITEESDNEIATEIYTLLGDLYFRDRCENEAFAAYEKALHHDPDNVVCLNNYAYFLSQKKQQLAKALQMSERVVKLEPQNPIYLDTHAWVLYQLRRYRQALVYIEQTIKYLEAQGEPSAEDAGYYDRAGDIYFQNGRRKTAIVFWKKALLLSDDAKLSATLKRKIRNRRL